MRIQKMTATFGVLKQAVLAPGEGLTVITAPNESGKSTWAGFWKAMLYGVDTRERDRAGSLADKNRYQPWSGAAMSGEAQVEWRGQSVTIRRFPTRSSPFGGFEAVYTDSGDKVPGLTAKTVGEALTGAGKEVYLRSAFVGQGGAALGQNDELEARIAALATAGQEDVSYSETERLLRSWRNRRRVNRATGLIPELEEELGQVDEALERVGQASRQREAAGEQIARLEREQAELDQQLELWDRLERQELNRRYGQALKSREQLQEELERLAPPEPQMADWTAQQAREWAEKKEWDYDEACQAREEALKRRLEAAEKSKGTIQLLRLLTILLAAAGLVGLALAAAKVLQAPFLLLAVLFLGACAAFFAQKGVQSQMARRQKRMRVPAEPARDNWRERVNRHTDYLARKERLESEARHAGQRVEDLSAQGARPVSTTEYLSPPALSRTEITARLRTVERELKRSRDELARSAGALDQMGDPDELETRRARLQAQLEQRLGEYDALSVALSALSEANSALRQRFSPALNQAAGEIFSALTGGRWRGLSLARDLSAQATQAEGVLPRSALALSAGTVEQLYLSVRLAICRLTLPDAPILLDDALAAFDDRRLALALEYLSELGRERQILLFTCQRREADWALAHAVPVLELT